MRNLSHSSPNANPKHTVFNSDPDLYTPVFALRYSKKLLPCFNIIYARYKNRCPDDHIVPIDYNFDPIWSYIIKAQWFLVHR